MEKLQVKTFSRPDEVREFENGQLELVKVNGSVIGRATLQPGWKWSEHVKPIANTKLCEAPHFQYQVSGVLKWILEDGSEVLTNAGTVVKAAAGHDAEVVGDEPVVVVDFQGMIEYAKR
ncbi:MAG: cupin [Elusimicrobia bacterium]|nr:cupin [Elusimicrobiota bacterium]